MRTLILWRYNPITGYWVRVRDVTSTTRKQWLTIWQKAEPGRAFKVSKNKPKGKPAQTSEKEQLRRLNAALRGE